MAEQLQRDTFAAPKDLDRRAALPCLSAAICHKKGADRSPGTGAASHALHFLRRTAAPVPWRARAASHHRYARRAQRRI